MQKVTKRFFEKSIEVAGIQKLKKFSNIFFSLSYTILDFPALFWNKLTHSSIQIMQNISTHHICVKKKRLVLTWQWPYFNENPNARGCTSKSSTVPVRVILFEWRKEKCPDDRQRVQGFLKTVYRITLIFRLYYWCPVTCTEDSCNFHRLHCNYNEGYWKKKKTDGDGGTMKNSLTTWLSFINVKLNLRNNSSQKVPISKWSSTDEKWE